MDSDNKNLSSHDLSRHSQRRHLAAWQHMDVALNFVSYLEAVVR